MSPNIIKKYLKKKKKEKENKENKKGRSLKGTFY